jgi:ABC-2 type transport system permease protein
MHWPDSFQANRRLRTVNLLLWLSTLGFMFVMHHFAASAHLLDPGPLLGGYLFVAVTGLLYMAIGILASSLARSQAVAAVIAVVVLVIVTVGPRLVGGMTLLQQDSVRTVRDALDAADVFRHLEDFTRGVIDTRQIVFYCTGTALALILSILGVEAKILRS